MSQLARFFISLFVIVLWVFPSYAFGTVQAGSAEIEIGNFTLVSSSRINRFEYAYVFKASAHNRAKNKRSGLFGFSSAQPKLAIKIQHHDGI
jgi:hypothetical protein